MSKGIVCDNCGTAIALDDRGEDEAGESVAWLHISTTTNNWDACTISCAHELMDGPIKVTVEAWLEGVQSVIRAINEESDTEGHPE